MNIPAFLFNLKYSHVARAFKHDGGSVVHKSASNLLQTDHVGHLAANVGTTVVAAEI